MQKKSEIFKWNLIGFQNPDLSGYYQFRRMQVMYKNRFTTVRFLGESNESSNTRKCHLYRI